jgi:hypothetical protein
LQFCVIYITSPNFWTIFSTEKVLKLAKFGFGFILGDFITKASGHPDYEASFDKINWSLGVKYTPMDELGTQR